MPSNLGGHSANERPVKFSFCTALLLSQVSFFHSLFLCGISVFTACSNYFSFSSFFFTKIKKKTTTLFVVQFYLFLDLSLKINPSLKVLLTSKATSLYFYSLLGLPLCFIVIFFPSSSPPPSVLNVSISPTLHACFLNEEGQNLFFFFFFNYLIQPSGCCMVRSE